MTVIFSSAEGAPVRVEGVLAIVIGTVTPGWLLDGIILRTLDGKEQPYRLKDFVRVEVQE